MLLQAEEALSTAKMLNYYQGRANIGDKQHASRVNKREKSQKCIKRLVSTNEALSRPKQVRRRNFCFNLLYYPSQATCIKILDSVAHVVYASQEWRAKGGKKKKKKDADGNTINYITFNDINDININDMNIVK